MRIWVTCFLVLFGATELLQWFKQVSLPLPVFVVAGVLLAIASNYDHRSQLPWEGDDHEPEPPSPEIPAAPSPPVPIVPRPRRSRRSISFEIRKPFQTGD